MIDVLCLAVSFDQIGPVKILAIIGGGALGGLLVGALAQLLSRGLTAQRLPRWPLNIIRLLGAVAAGWLVALWVFGGGGGGLGGPGGPGLGAGSGTENGKRPKEERPKTTPGDREPLPASAVLRVEVLGDPALQKITGIKTTDPKFDRTHRYRIESGGPKLLTRQEVEERITPDRKPRSPYRRVEIILYKDSPGPNSDDVTKLKGWAENVMSRDDRPVRVLVDDSQRHKDAPIR